MKKIALGTLLIVMITTEQNAMSTLPRAGYQAGQRFVQYGRQYAPTLGRQTAQQTVQAPRYFSSGVRSMPQQTCQWLRNMQTSARNAWQRVPTIKPATWATGAALGIGGAAAYLNHYRPDALVYAQEEEIAPYADYYNDIKHVRRAINRLPYSYDIRDSWAVRRTLEDIVKQADGNMSETDRINFAGMVNKFLLPHEDMEPELRTFYTYLGPQRGTIQFLFNSVMPDILLTNGANSWKQLSSNAIEMPATYVNFFNHIGQNAELKKNTLAAIEAILHGNAKVQVINKNLATTNAADMQTVEDILTLIKNIVEGRHGREITSEVNSFTRPVATTPDIPSK